MFVATLLACLALATPVATPQGPSPIDPNAAVELDPRPCAFEGKDDYEKRFYELEGWQGPNYERYPGACQRLRFAYGPLAVKPGQNDVLIGPITLEKPQRDGYITRFKPNLVRADGSVPPVEEIHLHHGTWLSVPSYGSGPFFAAGEEKTIAPFPKGYGMPVKTTDQWDLLYMVHSAVPQPREVFITYDVDFIPEAKAEELGLEAAYPVWLDVRPSGYPVFNTQRNYGGRDGKCTWPKEECAGFDPYGKTIVGQGKPGNAKGEDFKLPERGGELGKIEDFQGGTLIGIGGHLHPGGLQNEVDLVRPGREPSVLKYPLAKRKRRAAKRRRAKARNQSVARKRRARSCRVRRRKARAGDATTSRKGKRRARRRACRRKAKTEVVGDSVRIYTGQPSYWDWNNKSKPGGPPISWDFSAKVVGLPYWGVRVKPGDVLRSNATYDTTQQSTYENMGISVALLVPDDPDGKPNAPGVDPFTTLKDTSDGCKSGGIDAKPPRLCDKGIVTHGHYKENGNHSGPSGTWNAPRGSPTSSVEIADFLYQPGDFSTISMTGVPTVRLGSNLRFDNLDGNSIFHTATSCAFPCKGPTSASFPLADGTTSSGRPVDFDSSELGIGVPYIGPAKQTLTWDLPIKAEEGYQPGEVVTYFCRIHPSMRGAFEVTR